ncbi:hypothetical protein BDR04DRAFT_1123714, partial [Suillus decipiens]
MARSGHSTHSTSGRHRAHQQQTQKLTDKEIAELKSYLPEWTSTKRSEKQGVFTTIAQAARLFALKIDLGQWKKQKQMYKTWLFNNKKKKKRKDMIKHDDNEALGDSDSFMKTKDWEAIKPVWQECQGTGQRTTSENQLLNSKWMGMECWNYKAVIPWSAIIHSQDVFVARTFLLADVDLKEPSKLQNWDMMALLNFWYSWQEAGECLTFLFKAWKNKDGEMVPSVIVHFSHSHLT